MPAQRLGATSNDRAPFPAEPPCSAVIRACPTESIRANRSWVAAMADADIPASIRSASAQASSGVSRLITCSRMPKRSSRPDAAAFSRNRSSRAATTDGGSPHVR
jgi:hypothetical protein